MLRLFVDPISLRYLGGAQVDFVDNLTGGGFTIKNPNAKSTCGCGSSFNVLVSQAGAGELSVGSPPSTGLIGTRRESLGMDAQTAYVERLRPPGGKRSSKRDLIVSAFLHQDGHLSADDLVDLMRQDDHKISRATVYRTLQWMVDAGIARKVDFGEGRFRFEHAYRHPRHFHLICKSCNRSSEFLSSDIEVLLEEITLARGFEARQSVLQIYGTCEDCQSGRRTPGARSRRPSCYSPVDALKMAIATERSGLDFYVRGAKLVQDARARKVFQRLGEEEHEHLGILEERYRELLAGRSEAGVLPDVPVLQGGGTRAVRDRRRQTGADCRRPAGTHDWYPVRARVAQVLQTLRRTVRGLRGQADLSGVRRRRARASRVAESTSIERSRRVSAGAVQAPRARGRSAKGPRGP